MLSKAVTASNDLDCRQTDFCLDSNYFVFDLSWEYHRVNIFIHTHLPRLLLQKEVSLVSDTTYLSFHKKPTYILKNSNMALVTKYLGYSQKQLSKPYLFQKPIFVCTCCLKILPLFYCSCKNYHLQLYLKTIKKMLFWKISPRNSSRSLQFPASAGFISLRLNYEDFYLSESLRYTSVGEILENNCHFN